MHPNQKDETFIRMVNRIAIQSAESGFDPFGAILVRKGKIVATSIDKCIQYSDPTAHAELILISEFCRSNQVISLEEYSLYCNVEPCVMCSGAIHWSKISRVVYGVRQSTLQSLSNGRLKPSSESLINSGHKKTEIVGPLLEEEGLQVLHMFPFRSKKVRHEEYYRKKNKDS